MARKTHDAWRTIIEQLPIDLSKDVSYVTAVDIKRLTNQEPRNVAYMDQYESLPVEFQQAGVFVVPVKDGNYAVVRGKGYHELEELHIPIQKFSSRLPFPLLSAEYGAGEFQFVYYAHNCGLLEHFVDRGRLFPQAGGRKHSIPFDFKVNDHAQVSVKGVQTEVDAGFEGRDVMVLVEAKMGLPSSFIIRQLYYPYRTWQEVTGKETLSIFFYYDMPTKVYTLREYVFDDPLDYESIRLARAGRYQLVEQQVPLIDVPAPALVARGPRRHQMPQANSVERLLAFPFYVEQGNDRRETMASAQGFGPRQSDYYRQAMELLGFVAPHQRHASYQLTDLGRLYTSLPAPERNQLMMRQMFSLPVMHEVLMQLLLTPDHSLSVRELNALVERYAEKIGDSTIGRRGSTILAYLRWIGENVGALRVDKTGTVSLPNWKS